MNTRLWITLIVIFILVEVFMAILFIKYKQGRIDQNPFQLIMKKESKILYYSIFKWRNRETHQADAIFPLHQKSMYFWLFIALVHEQMIEMAVFHFWFRNEEPILAYFLTAIHIYSIFYIIGDYNWVRNSPILVKGNQVEMKIGARRELTFHISDIQMIQKAQLAYSKSGTLIHEKGAFHVTSFPRVLTRMFGISDELKHEIIFNKPITYRSYFGVKKQTTKALIYIDQSDQLTELLETKRFQSEMQLK